MNSELDQRRREAETLRADLNAALTRRNRLNDEIATLQNRVTVANAALSFAELEERRTAQGEAVHGL